jgi:hypothetical protein
MDHISTARTVYYLPGNGGQLHTGLGDGLLSRGWNVTGRATVDDFRTLRFNEQIVAIAADLQTHFWHPSAHVVANSFGAYLFLHAQAELPPFPGRVLLLSPIVGALEAAEGQKSFLPPRPEYLGAKAEAGTMPRPCKCEIHIGEVDRQSDPAVVQRFGALCGIPVHVAPGRGHMLGKDYVGLILDGWLGDPSS